MSDLRKLATPFDAKYIKKPPKGKYGTYVPHSIVTERLLEVVGPFDLDLIEVVRGYAPAIADRDGKVKYDAREGAIVGVVAKITAQVDGRTVRISEVGTEDNPAMHNDAENLKNAMSDAVKRCAMRLGLGLHLWSQSDYHLDKALGGQADEGGEFPPDPPASVTEPTLTEAEGARLTEALNKRGVDKILNFASDVTGRKVKRMTDLTKGEGKAVFQAADGGDPEKEAA